MLPAQPNQSLIDGLTVLQALSEASGPLGTTELARRLGFEVTRVNRLLKTLAHLGLARQTNDRRYLAGPGIHALAAQALHASGLLGRAFPHLQRLLTHGHTVALGVLWRDQVSYLFHSGKDQTTAAGVRARGVFPASRSSIGMVLLAARSDAEVRALYLGRTDIERFGADVDALIAELATVRSQGFARIDGRLHQGTDITMAVPVGRDPVAALAFSGVYDQREEARLLGVLRETAKLIEGDDGP